MVRGSINNGVSSPVFQSVAYHTLKPRRRGIVFAVATAVVAALALSLAAAGCGWKGKDRMTGFRETFHAYSGYLRWGDFHRAAAFSTARHAQAAKATIARLDNIRVTAVTSSNWSPDESQERISGSVKIQYYLPERGVVRETTQRQTWLWLEEIKDWRLDAGLPEPATR